MLPDDVVLDPVDDRGSQWTRGRWVPDRGTRRAREGLRQHRREVAQRNQPAQPSGANRPAHEVKTLTEVAQVIASRSSTAAYLIASAGFSNRLSRERPASRERHR